MRNDVENSDSNKSNKDVEDVNELAEEFGSAIINICEKRDASLHKIAASLAASIISVAGTLTMLFPPDERVEIADQIIFSVGHSLNEFYTYSKENRDHIMGGASDALLKRLNKNLNENV